MRRRLAFALVLGTWLLLTSTPTGMADIGLPFPTLNFALKASVVPAKLPSHGLEQAGLRLAGKVATTDGTHPAALREMVLDVDRDVRINTEGLPACRRPQLSGDTAAVRRACRDAIVGSGTAQFEVAPPGLERAVLSSPLTLLNGGTRNGETRLFLHAHLDTTPPETLLTTVEIRRKGDGLHTVIRIPPTASGEGSLTSFRFELLREYTHRGDAASYFEARCPDEVFKLNVPQALFKNEAQIPGVAASTVLRGGYTIPCAADG